MTPKEAAEIKKHIEERRIEKGFKTQYEFAKEAGISTKTYFNLLSGYPITSENLLKVAKTLDISVDYMLGLDKHKNIENEEIMKITGLSENSIETLRALNRMANEYPKDVDRVYMPHFVMHPEGSTEKVSDAEVVEISTIYCDDDPCAEPSAIIETLNDLLETTEINMKDYRVHSALLRIAEYIRADKAVSDDLKQYPAANGRIIQPITFNDGLMEKAMDVKELYREVKKKHIISALDEVIAIKEEGADDGKH